MLQLSLDKHLYFASEFALHHAPGLKPEQTDYFEGIVAFHQGRFEEAKKDLIAALNANPTILTSEQKIEAFETLGENARLTYLYGACAQMYQDIVQIWGDRLGPAQQDMRDKRHFCAVQQHTPVQTIDFNGPFTLKRHGDEYPVRIGDKDGFAEIDTGATESVITESTAKTWGIVPGEATVAMHGYTGDRFEAHPAIISELTIGTATLHNVAVLVTADKNFYIPRINLQINALLGFPVASALGRLTMSRDGSITVSPTSPPAPDTEGAPLWLGDSQLLVELETIPGSQGFKMGPGNEPRLFVLDTGSGDSYFTDHYVQEHPDTFPGAPPETARLAGAGGLAGIPAYASNHLPLWCGPAGFFVTGPHVLATAQGGVIENYEGLIGQDVLRSFKAYTIDLRSMRFIIEL